MGLTELQELAAKTVKKTSDTKGGAKKRKSGGMGDDTAEADEEDVATEKKKVEPAKKKAKKTQDKSANDLGSWVKKEEKFDADGNVVPDLPVKRQAGILLKFIEGHTNAVRRRVQFQDIM